jgi:hypothetical protein
VKGVLILTVVMLLALGSAFMIVTSRGMHSPVIINCGVAEISPDFTPEAREQCRRLRGQKS